MYNSVILIPNGGIMMSKEKRFTLRIDEDVFEKIKKEAEKNKRSITKEIEYLLDKHVDEKEEDS